MENKIQFGQSENCQPNKNELWAYKRGSYRKNEPNIAEFFVYTTMYTDKLVIVCKSPTKTNFPVVERAFV